MAWYDPRTWATRIQQAYRQPTRTSQRLEQRQVEWRRTHVEPYRQPTQPRRTLQEMSGSRLAMPSIWGAVRKERVVPTRKEIKVPTERKVVIEKEVAITPRRMGLLIGAKAILPTLRERLSRAEERRVEIEARHVIPLREYRTYPIYEKGIKVAREWRSAIERWEGVPRIREKIRETPILREAAALGRGIIVSPPSMIEFGAQIPPGLEYAAREPKRFIESVPVGGAIMVRETGRAFREKPLETAGVFVGMAFVGAALPTPKIPKIRMLKIKTTKPKAPPREVRPFTMRDIEMAERQAAIVAKEVPTKIDIIKAPIKEPYAISKQIKEIRQAEAGISHEVLGIKVKEVSPWERITAEDIYRGAGIKPKREPFVKMEKPRWLVEEIRETRIRERPVEEYYFPGEYIPLPEIKVAVPKRKVVVIAKERVMPDIKVVESIPEIRILPKVEVKVATKPKIATRVLTEADRSKPYLPKIRPIVGIAPLTKTKIDILTEILEKTIIKPIVETKIKEKMRVKAMPLVIPRTEVATETEVLTIPKTEVFLKVATEPKVKVKTEVKVPIIVKAPPSVKTSLIPFRLEAAGKKKRKKKLKRKEREWYERHYIPTIQELMKAPRGVGMMQPKILTMPTMPEINIPKL